MMPIARHVAELTRFLQRISFLLQYELSSSKILGSGAKMLVFTHRGGSTTLMHTVNRPTWVQSELTSVAHDGTTRNAYVISKSESNQADERNQLELSGALKKLRYREEHQGENAFVYQGITILINSPLRTKIAVGHGTSPPLQMEITIKTEKSDQVNNHFQNC